MEHKLRSALPPRTAWILIGASVLFWVLSALGLLQMPASVPPMLMFLWLYLNAFAMLASTVAVAAAVAALVLHRRSAGPAGAREAPAVTSLDAAEETGLDQLLGDAPPAVQPTVAPAGKGGRRQTGRPSRRKRKKRQGSGPKPD